MGAVSGQYGLIKVGSSNLQECTGWTLRRIAPVKKYASCETGGYKKGVAGVRDSNGTLSGIYDPDDPVDDFVEEGDSVTLKLYVTASLFYTVPAIIGELSLEVDVEEGEVERWSMTFEGNGAITKPS